jgi:plastocyanin
MMTTTRTAILGSLAAVFLASCGGGSPTSPGGGGGDGSVTVIVRDGGSTGASGATMTIANGALSPSTVTVAVGQTVTFINNDNRSHEIASNPHPIHGSCPSIEGGLGSLAPGQTKTTRAFGNSGSCQFHDHLDDNNAALRGRINVQ